jgi:hypothetical protein
MTDHRTTNAAEERIQHNASFHSHLCAAARQEAFLVFSLRRLLNACLLSNVTNNASCRLAA